MRKNCTLKLCKIIKYLGINIVKHYNIPFAQEYIFPYPEKMLETRDSAKHNL
jgi:hypothetical protein